MSILPCLASFEQGEWWYWKNKPVSNPRTGMDMHLCCGDFPIAFHGYKDSQWFFKLDNELYPGRHVSDGAGDEWKSYEWRNGDVLQGYFDRVRKAMAQETR